MEDTIGCLRNKNQQDALFYSQFISIINLYMFRADLLLIIMRYFSVYTAIDFGHALCWLAARNFGVEHITIAYIQGSTSCRLALNLQETCRG